VLLLDEPLSNLDAKLRAIARDELKNFQRRLGITTVFVTHDQIEAMGLGDRIVVMSQGQVQQVGTPQDIYDEPNNMFVATFLGSPSMNMIERDTYYQGFRPENFLPSGDAKHDIAYEHFSYHVRRVEYLGADRLLYGHLQGASEDTITLAKVPSNITLGISVDQEYDFAVPKTAIKYFDKQSGERTNRNGE
jgi:multiple sugar transport system ATP-binding protein